ncbi:MAG: DUF1887 family CARF protein [Syntrophorhabdaceae bacterium]|nr:DUF1887 family CARF protein [Syntrophorhabdaceae bacterium]MDD5242902.1 DUF1887 family CARF protein [Syntrophorhabdaceae bacterium]
MNRTHVCLVSDQPVPNLTTVLQFRPDLVILLVTTDKKAEGTRLKSVIEARGIPVEERSVEPYDLNSVLEASEDIIKKFRDHELSLNITGGTKIGTVGTFQSFYTAGRPIYYVDTRDSTILQISPQESRVPIDVSIPVVDYLRVYGFNVENYLKDDGPVFRRKDITGLLLDLAIGEPKLLGALNYSLQKLENMQYPLDAMLPDSPCIAVIAELLADRGFAKVKGRGYITLPSEEITVYLKGGWLEEYVYTTAKALNRGEVRMNVEGKWEGRVKHLPKNEFDILISYSNQLFLLSCKTSDPNRNADGAGETIAKEYIYELISLGDRALGLFGKKALVSARVLNPYVRDRASVLKIPVIEGKNIITLKSVLKSWMT